MTAFERGEEMMYVPMNKLPELALRYIQFLSKKLGVCAEVYLMAWCHYAECVERLPKSEDEAYQADDMARLFFAGGIL